jgi:hypothetical protein
MRNFVFLLEIFKNTQSKFVNFDETLKSFL